MNTKHSGLETLRLVCIILMFLAWCSAIVIKQLDLQVHKRSFLLAKKVEQQKGLIKLIPRRGVIYDCKGRVLAMSMDVDSIYAVPFKIKNREKTAVELSRRLSLGYRYVLTKLTNNKNFVWIKRKVEPSEARSVLESNLEGVYTYKENKRYYPHKELAASLIGFAGIDNDGLAGCEYQFDSTLKGKPGAIITLKDARRNLLSTGQLIKAFPTTGKDIFLTIDSLVQFYLEEEIRKTAEKFGVKQAFGIVMNPHNGDVLAVASYPEFDLNKYYRFSPNAHRNRALQMAFEPGSTFKLITAAAALETNAASFNDEFYCGNGFINIAGKTIKDHKPFGTLSFEDILIYSSNVGIIRVCQRIGDKAFVRILKSYGFGTKNGIDLPGENPGIVRDLKDWTDISIGSIAFGQEISVNGFQMLSFVSAIANGGYLIRPRILSGVEAPGAGVKADGAEPRRIFNARTAKKLVDVMEKVVVRGTGMKASLDEYSIAGKTGTAQKIGENGLTYEEGKYVSSFIGFAPADKPQIAMFLVFDEPKGLSDGGDVAAPAFKNAVLKILRYLNVPPLKEPHFFYEFPWQEPGQKLEYLFADFKTFNIEKDRRFFVGRPSEFIEKEKASFIDMLILPDFKGKSYKQVFEEIADMRLTPRLIGAGIAVDQYPKPGAMIKPKSVCIVYFSNKVNL